MLEEIKEEGEQQPEKAPTPEEIGLSGGDHPAGNILYEMPKSIFKRNKLILKVSIARAVWKKIRGES